MINDMDMEKSIVKITEFLRDHRFGKYRGLVETIGEGENLGLITAMVPEIYHDKESPWIRPAVPFAGDKYGFFMIPKKGDGVWIELEAGCPDKPIWTGFWWADGEIPIPAGKETRVLVTPRGHKIILDDENGKLQLLHPGGAEITMTDSDIKLKIGSTQIVLSEKGVNINNGAFKVK